jgi:hypothetical protein
MMRSRRSRCALVVLGLVLVVLCTSAVQATQTTFTYTQSDSAIGSGTIAPFSFDDGGGPINFSATPMPAAIVISPVAAPAGYVGAQNAQAGAANEANTAVGLTWSGFAIATGTRGTDIYQMTIPLVFAPEVNQTPDTNDYNWNVTYGDDAAADAASTSMRFAMWLSRDTTIDATETANTFQRYTQLNHTFAAGAPDSFTNTDTSTTAIKDATDAGAPAGTDAAGRDLAFYFGWRDQGALNAGAILINDFTVGGIINTDDASLRLIPEPGTIALACMGALGLAFALKRRLKK